ncbi:serine hydrolase domain-containing protein [Brevundimonas sp. A19_0]|uniref:serine hydrolase domain-containing protein n=1 Tax=Brevundimonas sp. A19_0 TaxID=2821087 RepID=UPI001ADBCF03|nr:serine hydrolase domain-containing protein [Brevundimonas sp. A19_0]MBO9502535.1 beta-lactamase family protein [Brevundimonas sp. A19_0]
MNGMRGFRARGLLLAGLVALWPTVALAQTATDAAPRPPLCEGAVTRLGPPPRPAPALDVWPASTFGVTGREDDALDDVLTRAAGAMGAESMGAAVLDADGLWSGRTGAEDSPLFWWASAGKLAVAVAVLQLVEEGAVALDDPVSRWVEEVPLGERITLGMLLDHTSGLYSSNEAASVRADPRFRTLDELVAVARDEGSLFCPGQGWRYSNTNYWLLGAVLEAVEGQPLDQILTRRIVNRARLSGVRFVTPDDALSDMQPLPPPDEARGEVVVHPAWVGAAGPMLATPEGAVSLLQAVLTGQLLPPERVRTMLDQPWPMFDQPMAYGRGLMIYEVPEPGRPLTWVGHSGGASGVKAAMVWSPVDQAYAAVVLTGPGSAEAAANALLRTRGRR